MLDNLSVDSASSTVKQNKEVLILASIVLVLFIESRNKIVSKTLKEIVQKVSNIFQNVMSLNIDLQSNLVTSLVFGLIYVATRVYFKNSLTKETNPSMKNAIFMGVAYALSNYSKELFVQLMKAPKVAAPKMA